MPGAEPRRRFLGAALAFGTLAALPARALPTGNPFSLGVASGYPTPDGITLWTRLMGPDNPFASTVHWEVAADETMRRIVASGSTQAEPQWGRSVHVDVHGLAPDRWYWYRFRAGEAVSPVGRTRTAPLAGAPVQRLRFAFGSCQQYEQGYYGAYRHVLADAPDLVVFLGDYIYESSWGRDHVRKHGAPEPYTLDEYRARHALYRSDPDLQAAHAACPWILTWDDHEVDNDYANDRSQDGMDPAAFLARRAAAYRAYYEHMPLPARMRPQGASMRLHTDVAWGALAHFHVLDTRQYRDAHACPRPGRGGANTVAPEECPQLTAPERTMLGQAQERWLASNLEGSRGRWNIVAQSLRMAQFDQKPGPGRTAWTDAWDGYPAARTRLLERLRRVSNPVVISGDIHAFNVSQLKLDFDDPRAPVVASEFVGTSISSQGWPQDRVNRFLPDNPHILFAESRYRGYTRIELTPARWRADLRAMDTVQNRDAPCTTLASYVVEHGRPGPVKA